MNDWFKIGKTAIFRDKSRGGLLSQFLKEHKQSFGGSINPSCQKCLNSYWANYIKHIAMSDNVKCDYELHKKYNGVQLTFGGEHVLNETLTNEKGEYLLKNHPRGILLFSKYPKLEVKEIKVVEPIKVVSKPKTQKAKRTPKKAK